MKTTKFIFSILVVAFFGATTMVNAQATTASTTNTVTSTAYLGSGATSNFDVQFRRNNFNAGRLGTNFTAFGLNTPLALPSSVLIGVSAGQFSSGTGFNTYIGQNAGKGFSASVLNTGTYNTYIGFDCGKGNTTGGFNTFIGTISGITNSTGSSNTFVGAQSGYGNLTGYNNVFLGSQSGGNNANGNNNVYLGHQTGTEYSQGNNNCFIGSNSGAEAIGSNNIFIGSNSGLTNQESNRLLIDVIDSPNSLIWGDFATDQLKFNGKVGIGGNSTTGFGSYPTEAGGIPVSTYQLFVKGGILTEEVRVNSVANWADYVFNKDYNLKTLSEVETFIKENGHLPNVPSAAQVKEEGIELGNMAKIQQEKIEELTLYIIELNKKMEAQEKRLNEMEQKQ
jgi:hypothetical protein